MAVYDERDGKYENRLCLEISLTPFWQICYVLLPSKVGAMTDYVRHGTHVAPSEAEHPIYSTTISNTQLRVVPRTLIDLKNSHSSISSRRILTSAAVE